MNTDIIWLLAFTHLSLFGPRRLHKIKQHFTSFQTAWYASSSELHGILEYAPIRQLVKYREELKPHVLFEAHGRASIHLITQDDPRYPCLLKQTSDAPPLLFARGTLPPADALLVSVVGTRTPSPYGRTVTMKVVDAAATCMTPVVSGLAFGVDVVAHERALQHTLPTVAILPGGLDVLSIVPSTHQSMAQRIVDHGGCLLSEHPIGTSVAKHSYPIRNRLIAGIANTTVITEARLASGSMITASLATQLNRTVLAVPGPINSPLSEGPNTLIHQGARPFLRAEDLHEAIGWRTSPNPKSHLSSLISSGGAGSSAEPNRASRDGSAGQIPPPTSPIPLSPSATKLLTLLPPHPCLLDDLCTHHSFPISALLAASTELEIAGVIRVLPGGLLERVA